MAYFSGIGQSIYAHDISWIMLILDLSEKNISVTLIIVLCQFMLVTLNHCDQHLTETTRGGALFCTKKQSLQARDMGGSNFNGPLLGTYFAI